MPKPDTLDFEQFVVEPIDLDQFAIDQPATQESVINDLAGPATQPKKVYLDDAEITVAVPRNASPEEIQDFAQTHVYDSMGAGRLGRVSSPPTPVSLGFAAVKGFSSFFATMPTIAGSLIREQALTAREGVTVPDYVKTRLGGFQLSDHEIFVGQRLATSPHSAVMEAYLAGSMLKRLIADRTTIDEQVDALGQGLIEFNARALQALKLNAPEAPAELLAYNIGSGGASVLTALGIAYATKRPDMAAAVFGIIQKGSMFQEALSAGTPATEASALSTGAGVAEAALEGLGLEIFMNTLRGAKPVMRTLLRIGTEGIQEGLQQTSEETIAKLGWNRPGGMADIAGRVGMASLVGMIVGGPVSATVTVMENQGWIGDLRRAGLTDREIQRVHEVITATAEKQRAVVGPMAVGLLEQDLAATTAEAASAVEEGAAQTRAASEKASEQTLGDVQALVTTQEDLEEFRRRLGMTTETRLKQGRINELVSQQKRVAAQLDQAGRELKELGGLPELEDSRNKIRERIAELNKKFDLLDNDIAEIMNDPAVRIRDAETVQAKAGQELQAIEQAFEQGRLSSQEEVKAAQDRAIKVLEGSDLDAEDRAKFLRTIKNVQTAEQLAKALPVIRERIGKLSEAASRRTLKARLAKVLKQTQPRESAGKPRGKFTPEIQELLDVARAIVGMSKTQAKEALQQSVETVRDGIPSPVEALRRRMLLVQAGAATSDEMAETVRLVETAIAQGRAAQDIMVQGRRQRAEVIIQEVVRIITGGAGVEAGAQTFGLKSREERVRELGLTARFKMLITTGIDSVVGWMDLLDELSLKDKTSKPGESLISQVGDVFEQSLAEKRGLRLANEQLRRMAEQAYGITESKVLIATLSGNTAPVPLGRFKSANGVEAEWVLSKDQAIKKWMELQDPTLQETLTSEKGNAYTPEMREALEAFLTDKDKAFARAQLAFYQEYYQGVNEVYKRLHMINLPFNPHYSPIRREGVAVSTSQGFGDLLEEVEMRATMEGGSFKSRVKNVHPLAMTSSMAVLQQHIAAMERFKAWGDKIRDLNIIFKDAEVRQAIIEQYGQGMYDRLLGFLEDFTRGGVNKAKRVAAVDAFRINFTRAALAVRPVILIKQLVSFPAFAEAMPTGEFVAGVSEFVTNPLGKTAILKESEFFKSRGLDIDRDIKDAMRSDAYRAFRQQENFVNTLMLNVQLGDQGAIAMGGWAVYRYARKQGQIHEEALMTFSRVANRTQQSGDLAEQSAFQRGGSVAKLFSMFQSAPNQYLRREIAALRNFRAGRMSGAQLAKTIAIYHFLLPMLFQLASDAFRWDEEEQLRAVILGPLNGLFIVGDMLDMVIRQVLEMRQFGLDVVPMASLMREVTTAVSLAPDAVMFNLSTEEVLEGIKALASVVGALRGVPLRAGIEMLESAVTLAEGDLRNGLFGLMGWTDFALEED